MRTGRLVTISGGVHPRRNSGEQKLEKKLNKKNWILKIWIQKNLN